MKILKLLNKNLSIILFFILLTFEARSNDPVDIWSTEDINSSEKKIILNSSKEENTTKDSIYNISSNKKNDNIEEDSSLASQNIKIVGLYDPAESGLDINMWSNTDGDQIISLFKRINKIDLSDDASEILNTILLTNAFYPQKNITKEKFIKIKSDWLIKNHNLKLIESYLLKNQIVNEDPKLMRFLLDEHLSNSQIEKSCEILLKVKKSINDNYLSKFKIYCLVNDNKIDEAILLLDLKKELNFNDKFFEDKIYSMIGYKKTDDKISENSILDFHLSHKTNTDFKFEPNDMTSKLIWKYLSSSNLLYSVKDVEITDLNKIATIEKATHEKNYSEKELFELYKRFQFSINQLLNTEGSYKTSSNIEERALIFQRILISNEVEKKIELIKILKDSFIDDGIENAFSDELFKFLSKLSKDEIPFKYLGFYEKFANKKEPILTKIKINNKILHQSKLLNYLNKESEVKIIEKELNDFLKKIKKNKKYFFSVKDIILVETLKSDGATILNKYANLYEVNESEMPADIQYLIDSKDMGLAMLRIVEVIGQDEIVNIDPETMYFVISTINQLNVDILRNKILFKFLPLKVQKL
jgi:hypothetical protein